LPIPLLEPVINAYFMVIKLTAPILHLLYPYVKMLTDMVDKFDIVKNLNILGLANEEAELYLLLTSKDSYSILELSKESHIPRTTVYRICQKLVEKKFAEWIVDEYNFKKIRAVRPSKLTSLIAETKSLLEIKEKSLQDLQAMIADTPSKIPSTQVRFYEGKEGMQQVMWNALSAEKETIGYSVYGRREVVGEAFNSKFVQEFRMRKLRDRTVINEEGREYLKKYFSPAWHQQNAGDIRFIPQKRFFIKGDITIYNNIYAVCFWREGEVVAFEVESPLFVQNQKSIFEILWGVAKPLAVDKIPMPNDNHAH